MTEQERQRIIRMRKIKARKKRRRKILIKKILACLCLLAIIVVFGLIFYKLGSFIFAKARGDVKKIDPVTKEEYVVTKKDIINEASLQATQYDYDGAIKTIKGIKGYKKDKSLQKLVKTYKDAKASCVAFPVEDIEHVFYHSLVVDPNAAFNHGDNLDDGWKQWMTTVDEFNKITQSMYDKGYVLVSLHDLVKEVKYDDGTKGFVANDELMLPEGKIPFVLSLDDLCYYHAYEGRGTAMKLILDKNGNVTNEFPKGNKTVTGSYDCVPLLNDFVKEHPDFSYHGAMGTIALTGYNGVLGYRTDIAYKTKQDLDTNQEVWLDEHPKFNYNIECKEAKKVADKIKADGWEFASHTWGHIHIADYSLDSLKSDTENWLNYVAPIVGGSDIIIFAHGQDINKDKEYTSADEKFVYLESQGFKYYCNVDASDPFIYSIGTNYLRMGRVDLDGYRIWMDAKEGYTRLTNLFDANEVLDPSRTDMPGL